MAKKTIVIDGDDRQHFSLVVEEGVVRIGDTPSHTEGVARDLRITRIHCEVEVEDDRDHMAIDEPGVLAPCTLFPGTAVQLGHVHLVLVPATPSPATVPGETVAASALRRCADRARSRAVAAGCGWRQPGARVPASGRGRRDRGKNRQAGRGGAR